MLRVSMLFVSLLAVVPVHAQSDSMVVTLLGTGTPNPRIERMGPSTLVEAERLPPDGGRIEAIEFRSDTVVFDDGGMRVEAFEVGHGGALRPAHGYRVTYGGRSVVISGDTRYSEHLVRYARGADVILHEVAMAPEAIRDEPPARFILAHHTSPAEVVRVFEASRAWGVHAVCVPAG